MKHIIIPDQQSTVPVIYDPVKGLKLIDLAQAGERFFARAKDTRQLFKAIQTKLTAQADYVVWRDATAARHVQPKRGNGKGGKVSDLKSYLPEDDPGDVAACRWRKRLTTKENGRTVIDPTKLETALREAEKRCRRIVEGEPTGVFAAISLHGLGQYESYTPQKYVELVRKVLGTIDVDPASCEEAQATVGATQFYIVETNGLKQAWRGTVFLNPPYDRKLILAFIKKLVSELDAGHVKRAVLLTNNSTDVAWFDAALSRCKSVCFPRTRIKFGRPGGAHVMGLTQGQAFFFFSQNEKDVERFEDIFSKIGNCVRPSKLYSGK